jgi:hypothetical protein
MALYPMPHSKVSEVKLFVDGEILRMVLGGADEIVNLPNGGMLSLGIFGYKGRGRDSVLQRTGYREGPNFVGSFNDVTVFARSLIDSEVKELSTPQASIALRSKTSYDIHQVFCLGFGLFGDDIVISNCNDQDGQQWVQDSLGYIHNKDIYEICLIPEVENGGRYSVKVEDCNFAIDSTFAWLLESRHVLHQDTNKFLSMSTDNSNAIKLSAASFEPESRWDIVYE